jgi:hypothetical protein
MHKPRTITLEQYEEAERLQHGICKSCGATRECCEPDARNYRCDECGERRVFGPHEWLMEGRVT